VSIVDDQAEFEAARGAFFKELAILLEAQPEGRESVVCVSLLEMGAKLARACLSTREEAEKLVKLCVLAGFKVAEEYMKQGGIE